MTPPLTLQVEQLVPATPQQVFDAWTSAEVLALWWAPPGGRCLSASIDLRVGGTFAIVNELPDDVIVTIRGEYLAIEPPSTLRFTWTTHDVQPATEIVTVTFQARGEHTSVGIVHTKVPSEEVAEGHAVGWESCLRGLANRFDLGH